VLAPLRRIARFVRLALVCLTLVWSSAPAAAAPLTDGIALVADVRAWTTARATATAHPTAARSVRAESAVGRAAPRDEASPSAEWISPDEPARRPRRRLYLEHRSILC
jgi:hypothetical protein